MKADLTVGNIVSNGFQKGIKNIVPLFVNSILWILTIWIPYLNVGTTIGMVVGVVAKSGKDEAISMTEIFDPKYRKYMGEFFLVQGLQAMGVGVGSLLMFIPGIVISLAWSLGTLLTVDKGMNPVQALSKSNELTYGKKWTMFLGMLVVYLLPVIGVMIVAGILGKILSILGALVAIAGIAFVISVLVSAMGYIYTTLTNE